MKVRWQLVDSETKKAVSVGKKFELIDFMKQYFDREESMPWNEALILFGDPISIKNPVGILNCTNLGRKKPRYERPENRPKPTPNPQIKGRK